MLIFVAVKASCMSSPYGSSVVVKVLNRLLLHDGLHKLSQQARCALAARPVFKIPVQGKPSKAQQAVEADEIRLPTAQNSHQRA